MSRRSKRGEINELKAKFRDPATERDPNRKRECIKKVLAQMTLGVDTSALFSEMIMASATNDLVQKKMVYLYLASHAESNADLALLAVNTLQKDCRDESPLIRGLALRCLASLKVKSVTEYMLPILRTTLFDTSPYVRKTAVLACLKLWRLNPEAFAGLNVMDRLHQLVRDVDPLVCCNAIIVLNEVMRGENGSGLPITKSLIYLLLNRLREFTDWQQFLVMQLLLRYTPEAESEVFDIMNLLEERLKGSNSAVILAVAKVFLQLTQNNADLHRQVFVRLRDPMLTLVSTSPVETAYAVLCHVKLMASRQPQVFASSFKDFYIRYTDPNYVRAVKLEILVELASESNFKEIIEELCEFATDASVETARGAVRTMGRIAIRLPSAAQPCTKHFLEFLQTEQAHLQAETLILLKDFMRKYRDITLLRRFFPALLQLWKNVEETEAKVAMVWILGEYGEEIDDAPYILEHFAEAFLTHPAEVRAELLTACMKLFFKRPPEMQPVLGPVLEAAIRDFSHADVHDRSLLYYRLLVKDPKVAEAVVTLPKEPLSGFTTDESPEIKDKLFEEFNSLSVIYWMPAERFVVSKPGTGDLVLLGANAEQAPERACSVASKDEVQEEVEELEMGLLGAGGPSGASPLDPDATVDPTVFQQKWASLTVSETLRLQLRHQPSAEEVEQALGEHFVFCVASGSQQGSHKFYFYAVFTGSPPDQICMAEAIVDSDGRMIASFKSQHPRLVDLLPIFRQALKVFMA
eukprot:RCo047490